jgi:hypothetical protein
MHMPCVHWMNKIRQAVHWLQKIGRKLTQFLLSGHRELQGGQLNSLPYGG